MTKQGIIAGAVFLLALPASAVGLAGTDIAYIEQSDCDAIAVHFPGGADYVPGVAADGSRVAPADLGGGYAYGLRPVYEFDMTLDPLIGRNPAFNSATKMTVARVSIDMTTGRTTIDGHDVSGANHALAEACARLHHKPVK
ncbi:MAG: hypothetical protein RIC04_16395 [Parvibaculum sp.]|uniref:hypothetical protein n=1 Tax=Parvibaculum sp. TaxID=2024848 RepID=UPI0032EC4C5B